MKRLNHTYVSLIPKKSHNPTVSDFCPIACTNTVYKIINKVLANRMNLILGDVINPAQSGFVKG